MFCLAGTTPANTGRDDGAARRRSVRAEGYSSVNVVGSAGEQIGTVERFEIDQTGRLKSLVVRIASSLSINITASKRIGVERIRSIDDSSVSVAVSESDLRTLADVYEPSLDDLILDEEPPELRAS